MEVASFSLRIDSNKSNYNDISRILEINIEDFSRGWIYEITQVGNEHVDFINLFLDILDGKYDLLHKLGVLRDNISIWMVYPFRDQCNLEFLPKDLKRLGENEVTLCISCYESGT